MILVSDVHAAAAVPSKLDPPCCVPTLVEIVAPRLLRLRASSVTRGRVERVEFVLHAARWRSEYVQQSGDFKRRVDIFLVRR